MDKITTLTIGDATFEIVDETARSSIPKKLSNLSTDANHRTVTDLEKTTWNNKSDFSGNYDDLNNKPSIPTKTSQLQNDSGFITKLPDLSGYALKNDVPENLSQLGTDTTHRTVTDAEKQTWNNKSDFSGDYNDLTNKPKIPTKTSDLENDSGFGSGAGSVDLSGYALKADVPTKLSQLASDSTHRTVTDAQINQWSKESRFSGSYNDLTDKTHGKETVCLIDEKSIYTDDYGEYYFSEPLGIIVGQTYVVTINDDMYERVAWSYEGGDFTAYGIGNSADSVYGDADFTDPFTIGTIDMDGELSSLIMVDDGATTLDLSVKYEKIIKLDPIYVDIPESLKNPYPLIINGESYDGSKTVKISVEGTGGGDVVNTTVNANVLVTDKVAPDYVIEEIERLAGTVQTRQHANTLSWISVSDAHFSYTISNANQQAESIFNCGQAVDYLRKLIFVDFGIMHGDLCWDSGESVDSALRAMRYVHSQFKGLDFWLRGNHECLYNNSTGLTDKQIFANVGIYNKGAEYDPNNRIGGYCYYDLEDIGVRCVFVNTCESSDGSFAVSSAQNTWLKSVLNVSDLSWCKGTIIFSHYPLDWTSSTTNIMQTVKSATKVLCNVHGHVHGFLVDKLTGTSIPRIATPNACFGRENEYGENGKAENSEGTEFGETITYKKTSGTCEDTAFVCYTLDFDNMRLYADHYGAGYSRVISLNGETIPTYTITHNLSNVTNSCPTTTVTEGASFTEMLKGMNGYKVESCTITMGGKNITESAYSSRKVNIPYVTGNIVITASGEVGTEEDEPTVNYTNLVPTSTDANGNIYNSKGYKTGYRLNSSGTESALENAIVSGFIPYNGEVIRAWGSTVSTPATVGNYIALYDASFTKLQVIAGGTTDGMAYEELNGKYLMTLTPEGLNSTNKTYLENTKYIRCSFGQCLSPTEFTITLDEVIE